MAACGAAAPQGAIPAVPKRGHIECEGAAAHCRAPLKRAACCLYPLNAESAMTQEEKAERQPARQRSRGISLYASSADYERRMSEDIPRESDTEIADETQADDA